LAGAAQALAALSTTQDLETSADSVFFTRQAARAEPTTTLFYLAVGPAAAAVTGQRVALA
jgi:hypothetical protein